MRRLAKKVDLGSRRKKRSALTHAETEVASRTKAVEDLVVELMRYNVPITLLAKESPDPYTQLQRAAGS